ncbi:hypothetical protein [Streptomyces sp. NPDC003023]|uniref:hypothetical protein n=1 Tax=Streptomyces sp. NPDC003023 TaxID=3364675 RepID=UPI00368CAAB4
MDDLTLKQDSALTSTSGTTCKGEAADGSAVEWVICVPGRPRLTIRDTQWDNGERDIVLYQPTLVPEIPAVLSNLHNRLRVGVEPVAGASPAALRVMAYPVWTDGDRPRIKKSLTTADLAARCGLPGLRVLVARSGVTIEGEVGRSGAFVRCDLEDPQTEQRLQHRIRFPADDGDIPVIAFTHLRVTPVLRHIGWLPANAA